MIVARIEGCTRVLGKTQGFIGLPIRDQEVQDTGTQEVYPAMMSAWEPTPAELAALNAGAKIVLTIIGQAHPPVALTVGPIPELNS